ncbi:MAG TPA: OmpH family outer membrane protein [Abditibacteriaceae bacterium]|jgi:ABC-type taurine transport system substrate-binding protein
MKLFKRSARLAAVVMLCLASAGTVVSPPAVQAQTVSIGVVDEDKLGDGYTKYKDAITKMQTRVKNLEDQLESRKLLNDTEGAQFEALIVKENRTKAEEDTFQTLVKSGLDRQNEYIRLNGTAARTEADNTRLKQLQTQGASNIPKFQTLSDTLFSTLKKQQDETDRQFTEQARKVIGEVAAEKKLSLVVRSVAIIWSAPTTDITQEVLTRLNKS